MKIDTIIEAIALLNSANYDAETLNEKRDEVVEKLKEQLSIAFANDMQGFNGSAYRDELLGKIDSMKLTSSKFFKKDTEFSKGNNVALNNMRVHITEIFKKHFH